MIFYIDLFLTVSIPAWSHADMLFKGTVKMTNVIEPRLETHGVDRLVGMVQQFTGTVDPSGRDELQETLAEDLA